jgi:formylglycine-generating enzyme required for sulfatase activity
MGRAACAPPDERVFVPAAHLVIGAADWEAEGRVPTREVDVHAFYIDRFEVAEEGARARAGVTRDEAEAYCRARGGRLPTDDEWTAAAAGSAGRRYPWGDTGAVCRRAAWGLRTGPCASAPSSGPDTVGAHADGATPNGIHDLAGNVAEWVAASPSDPSRGIARGGSFRSTLAADLRTWAREEVDPAQRHPWVGFRCAYDSP